jgi:predicted small secreted protein
MKRAALPIIFAFLISGLLSACNTVEGFGKDVQEVGEEVEEAAD